MNDEPRLSGTVQIALRIPPELRERVKKAAEANNRSVNSELVATLEEKYPAKPVDLVARALEIAEAMFAITRSIDIEDIDGVDLALGLAKIHELEKEFEAIKAVTPSLQGFDGQILNVLRKRPASS